MSCRKCETALETAEPKAAARGSYEGVAASWSEQTTELMAAWKEGGCGEQEAQQDALKKQEP